ncbi:MAG: hypothetical protein AAF829_06840 [Pseudomonadota bacterium]
MQFLDDVTFPGTGFNAGAFVHRRLNVFAIASEFRLLTQPRARATYGGTRPRRRVGLYEHRERRPFAWLDSLRYPINDVAFHPSQPIAAIATGRYDDGYMFEGELVLWNWETGKTGQPLIQTPEVSRAAFSPDGTTIFAYVRPWDEGFAEERAPSRDLFDLFYEVRATLFQDLSQGVGEAGSVVDQMNRQSAVGSDAIVNDPRFDPIKDPEDVLVEQSGSANRVVRSPIWDLAWLDENTIGAVHDDCHLHITGIDGRPTSLFKGDGVGCELFGGSAPMVHVTSENNDEDWANRFTSKLLAFRNNHLEILGAFEGAHTFSRSSCGRILGRRDRSGSKSVDKSQDRFFDGENWRHLALGHYDVFNHYLRIDDAPHLFFVQNDQPDAGPLDYLDSRTGRIVHPEKYLCALENAGSIRRLWPVLEADGSFESHPMECSFAYAFDEDGEAMFVGGKHYNPNPRTGFSGFIYRRELWSGKEIWRHPLNASPSNIVHIPEVGIVLVFCLNGEFLFINARSGRLLNAATTEIDGLTTPVFSCAARSAELALGTMDGRIILTHLEELIV